MNRRKAYISMQLAIALLLPIVLLFPASAYAATTVYIGSPGGDWNTPGNWSGGAVPGPEDTAVIGNTNVVIGSTPPNPGSVEIGPATRIDVDAGQSLTVVHSMTLTTTCQSCGQIQFFGPGSIGFAPGATLSLTLGPPETPGLWGQLQLIEGMTLTLPGPGAATSWTSGTFVLEGAFGTTSLVVPAGATFPLLDGGTIYASTTSDRVINNGTIVKGGAGTTALNPRLRNTGTVSVAEGALNVGNGPPDGQHHTGAFTVAQGAELRLLGGAHHLGSGASFSGQGTLMYAGGTIEAGAAIPVERMRFGGAIVFGAGSSLSVASSLALASGANAQFNGAGAVGFSAGATLSTEPGFGQLQLLGGFDFTLPPGTGTSWTAGSIHLRAAAAITSFVVPPGATFPVLDGGSIGSNTTSDLARIVNDGTITKSGPGRTSVGPQVFNSGLIEVQAGAVGPTLYTQDSGEIAVASGALLEGTVILNGGTLRGRGSVSNVTNNGGTFAPGGAGERGSFSVLGNYTQAAGGTLEVDINGNFLGSGGPGGYDRLAVGATANLAGTLAIVNDPSFVPQQTDVFTILTRAGGTGTFGTVTGTVIPAGTYEASYAPTQVNLGFVPNPPENNGPVAVNDAATVEEDSSDNPIDVLANDSDPDGDPLTIAEPSDPANGSVTCTSALCSYTPDPGYAGPDAFTYTAVDDKGARSKEATVSITVSLLNNGPVAVNDAATVEEDSSDNPIDVLANDSDPDGDPLTIAEPSDPANGSVTCTSALCSYTPDPGYAGPDAFTYTAVDDKGARSKEATVSITVSPRDTIAPVVTVPADMTVDATSAAGATVTFSASARDNVDPSPSLTCSPSSGSVFPIGTTTVTCTATDDAGNSASATFSVSVRGAAAQIVDLIDKTLRFLDLPSLGPVLRARLEAVAQALIANNKPDACRALNLYIAVVQLAPSSALTAAEKSELRADANRIKAVIGC